MPRSRCSLRTVISLDGRLDSGEVGILLDPAADGADQVDEPVLSPDDWAELRLARPHHYGSHLPVSGVEVDQPQGGQGRACERCGHVAHRAPQAGPRA